MNKEIAYIVIRKQDKTPVAICELVEEADEIAGQFEQECMDADVALNFEVIACPFYPE